MTRGREPEARGEGSDAGGREPRVSGGLLLFVCYVVRRRKAKGKEDLAYGAEDKQMLLVVVER